MSSGLRSRPLRFGVGLAALALVAPACGGSDDDGDQASPTRTVDISMVDVAFEPTEVSVAAGETVRFRFTNEGKAEHEAFLGTVAEQEDHEQEMSKGSVDHGGHDMGSMGGGEEAAITVEPGDRGELTTTYGEPGTYEIGCHEPGHYEQGMKISVKVT